MKKIEAIIRPEKLEAVRTALAEYGILGMTVTEVSGRGRQQITLQWRAGDYRVELLWKDEAALAVRKNGVEALMVWDPEELADLEVYPFWQMPLVTEDDEPRPLVVDAHFGPDEDASLSVLVTTHLEGSTRIAQVDEARARLEAVVQRVRED